MAYSPARPFRIHGVGCALVDMVYDRVDFGGETFARYASRRPGDGGLVPGQLVFGEDLQRFADRPLTEIIGDLCGERPADSHNLGGPAIVALVAAAQLLHDEPAATAYFGRKGEDEASRFIDGILAHTPLDTTRYADCAMHTPSTRVLSDPSYEGTGERLFVNEIGAAHEMTPAALDEDFFAAEVVLFGATALVPPIHDELTALLARAKDAGRYTVVTTVYDFRNQQRAPDRPWPLGDTAASLPLIDCLLLDAEEARRISGEEDLDRALAHFAGGGTEAVAITDGIRPVRIAWQGGMDSRETCHRVDEELAEFAGQGDTTGCGDNFAGGTIAELARQMIHGETLDFPRAVEIGICTGGSACFHLGGTWLEDTPGAKAARIAALHAAYREQLAS